jgi:hypothetical protein
MENVENNSQVSAFLTLKSEEQKNKMNWNLTEPSEVTTLKLIHELEVHQIELEMQNEELLLAKSKEQQWKNTKLYDYAPSGYFTLGR